MASFATASDALTAALAVVDARLTNIDVNEKLELYLELINRRAAIQQVIAASGGGGTVIQKSNAFQSSASLTRGNAITTSYLANDVIFGAFELQNIGNNAGSIFLTEIHFVMNTTALPSGIGNLRAFLYNVTPPSAYLDNNAFSVPSGDRASILTPQGISLGTPALANGGGSLVLSRMNINQQFKLLGTSLFGYLVTEGAWVPTANPETATIRVMAIEA